MGDFSSSKDKASPLAASPIFSVRTAPDAAALEASLPLRVAVYGDMGVDKGAWMVFIRG